MPVIKSGQYKVYRDKRGFTQKVVNTKGKAGRIVIVQRADTPGFTLLKENGRKLRKVGVGRTEPAALKKAIKKGYRTTEFWD